jgi:hypothetical protein
MKVVHFMQRGLQEGWVLFPEKRLSDRSIREMNIFVERPKPHYAEEKDILLRHKIL